MKTIHYWLMPMLKQQTDDFTIIKMTAKYHDMDITQLLGKRKTNRNVFARYMAMALIRERTTLSLNKIGKAFGKRDHSTVIHGLNQHRNLMMYDTDYANKFNQLKEAI